MIKVSGLYSTGLLFLFLIFTANVRSQELPGHIADSLRSRPELYVTLPLSTLKSIPPGLLKGIAGIREDSAEFYLTPADTSLIRKFGHLMNPSTPPSMRMSVKMADSIEEVLAIGGYPTYPLYLELMNYFRSGWPDICTIDTIGGTPGDHLILAARLSKSSSPESLPILMFTSTMHGDETTGYMLTLLLINEILENNTKGIFSELLRNATLIIVPLENPDGCYFNSDLTIFGATRGNLNGVDLNRNYPDPEEGPNPDGNPTQSEVTDMINYMNTWPPNLSANFHGGTEVVNYPFDTWPNLHADDEWFRFISREYADSARSRLDDYMTGFDDGITNGFQWYEVAGGRQDYVTYFLHGRETTIELSQQKTVDISTLAELWEANRGSMLNYLSQGLYGIEGRVQDSLTGLPLEAEILLPGHDKLESQVYTRASNGTFFRYLKEGEYSLRAYAEGYTPSSIHEIQMDDYSKKKLNISLLPTSYSPETFSYKLHPVPFASSLEIEIEAPEEEFVHISFYDLYGTRVYYAFYDLNRGFNSRVVQPGLQTGMYIIELQYKGKSFREKLICIHP